MQRILCLLLTLLVLLPASAQRAPISRRGPNAGNAGNNADAGGLKLLEIDDDNLAALAKLGGDVDAISLEASRAALAADAASWKGLKAWVRGGGVVFLHTDAAQLFGYRTVRARQTSNRIGGQLFGRARAALPFGAHPLLWGGQAERGTYGGLGVRVVYYQLNPGDSLAVDHPAAVPLLRVTDLAAPAQNTLYAAAMAPYGSGWAVFVPAVVETHRADGAAFLDNLTHLIASARGSRTLETALEGETPPTGQPGARLPLASLPASLLEESSDAARQGKNFDGAALAQQVRDGLDPGLAVLTPATPKPKDETAKETAQDEARLLLTRPEINSLIAALAADQNAGNDRAPAALYVLRARLELQRDDLDAATTWLTLANRAAPAAAEPLLWRGILAAADADDYTLASQRRAALLADAAASWNAALGAPALLGAAKTQGVTGGTRGGTDISGVSRQTIAAWLRAAGALANILSTEPPLTAGLGDAASNVVLRHFSNDPTLRLAMPTAQAMARSPGSLGWRVDEEELLIFPTPEYYVAYRRAAGLGQQNVPNPARQYGDIVGSRIMMVAQATLPLFLPATTPGGQPRLVQFGTAVPAALGRMHAYVLMNQLAGGGTPVPPWVQLGLASLTNLTVVNDIQETALPMGSLRDMARGGALLTPSQFGGAGINSGTNGLAEAEATRLMTFFYNRFGAGRVMETLQRLGAGQSVDEALLATTGLNEAQFFTAWSNAEFGGLVP